MEQFPNYAFWVEMGNLTAVSLKHFMNHGKFRLGCFLEIHSKPYHAYRMDVTSCAVHETVKRPRHTEAWSQNLWKKSQRRETTTYYLCDLEALEIGQKVSLCHTVLFHRLDEVAVRHKSCFSCAGLG